MNVKLTEFSKSAGCGCKIAPAVLEEILKTNSAEPVFSQLLVGNETRDDAAIFQLNEEDCIISTNDFFMPIVDDAFDFGQIAAANAISDVYAMGGVPIMALGILGWPVESIPLSEAKRVMEGAKSICLSAGIPLAGGHSIDSKEPFFGLAVTGQIKKSYIKKNTGSKPGDYLYLSKKLGSGILASAFKRGQLKEEEYQELLNTMTDLNKSGSYLSQFPYVHAMTDVTGFGLLGHLLEMLQDTHSAEINYAALPKLKGVEDYMSKFIYPDNTTRNYNAVKEKVEGLNGIEFLLLCDPQTSGGLLVSVSEEKKNNFENEVENLSTEFICIGRIRNKTNYSIRIIHETN